MTACYHGEIPFKLLTGRTEAAYDAAKWFRELFKDDFYIEIQNHRLEKQLEVLPQLIQLSKNLSIPLVATNDVHYLDREDADARDVLICIQTNNVLSNPDRPMKKDTEEMYFKSGEEMRALFADVPESLDITLDIASKCNYEFKLGTYFLPEFQVPRDFTVDEYFEKICREGFERLRPHLEGRKNPIKAYEERRKQDAPWLFTGT